MISNKGKTENPALAKFAIAVSLILASFVLPASGQDQDEAGKGFGGSEHQASIYGVTIGMDVPTALRAVFETAERKPGQEKPDALKKEGKDGQDIRVVYKDLPKGELQVVFARGVAVSEIVLVYRQEINADELRLPFTTTIGSTTSTIWNTSASQSGGGTPGVIDGSTDINSYGNEKKGSIDDFSAKRIGNVDRSSSDLLDGTRYDDRYVVGFSDTRKQQKMWWRDEKTMGGYSVRIYFAGKKLTDAGGKFRPTIVQKSIVVTPGDEDAFAAAYFK